MFFKLRLQIHWKNFVQGRIGGRHTSGDERDGWNRENILYIFPKYVPGGEEGWLFY
jgi:hypothetical protein